MRILALQTSIAALKNQFIVEGEEAILITTHHPFAFIAPMIIATILTAFALSLVTIVFVLFNDDPMHLTMMYIGGIAIIIYIYNLFHAYINWRFNFLMVTTNKVVIITQRSFFYHNVYPVHLENIASTKYESQFLGILRCGIVHISLKEREGGTTREIALPYVPRPDVVTSAIENAIALEKQRSTHQETTQEQLPKVQEVQLKIDESVGKNTSAPTEQPPAH